jgi:uncharacterized spore protein YtfJ
MKLQDAIARTSDVFSAKRVFGEPYEKDGITVIPAAQVMGGGGGGGDESQDASSGGSGYGLVARPVGAYVIRNGEVEWQPAVDRTVLVLALGGLAALVLRGVAKRI